MSKLPPRVPLRIIQHWKCKFGKRWRRKTAICGENTCVIADGFPWRINCFPEPNDSHLLMAYWTSAFICLGKLLIAGPVFVANARFWSFNTSGRSLIQFMANAASSRMLKLARSMKSLISACCRYCGAWIEMTLPWIYGLQELFEFAIPLEPHVCVSLVPTQVVVRDCQNYEKSTWVSFHARESIGRDTFSEGIVPFFQKPNLSWFWSQNKEMFTTKNLIFCYGQAQTALLPYDFFFASSFW